MTRESVLLAEHVVVTGRVQEVVTTHIVGDDRQQRLALIGPQLIACRQVHGAAEVERTTIRQSLLSIERDSEQVTALSALGIDEAQMLAAG